MKTNLCPICLCQCTRPASLNLHLDVQKDEKHIIFMQKISRMYLEEKMSPFMISNSLELHINIIKFVLKKLNIKIRNHKEAVANSVSQNRQNINAYGRGGFRNDLNGYYRSTPEANFARILKYEKIEFEHEVPFSLNDENGKLLCTYFLDFLIKNQGFEIKGYEEENGDFKNREKISLFKKLYPQIKLKVIFCNREEWKQLVKKYCEILCAISMELIPRTTRAQKMDVLSSQANLGGYVAVILAAAHANKIFPMMTTAAGTILPAKVFIIGAGVAGLQAIATAKRLGAKVTAYDTRPVVEEQVKSLGGQFLKIDLGETGQTKDGYAKALTEEQVQKQRDAMKKTCGDSDVVITAAQVFGRRAPILVTAEMLNAMKPGSVVVDLAVETGGNVEGVVYDQVADRNGVKIVGIANLPARVPLHASQVYSANLTGLIEEFWDKPNKQFVLKLDDEIIKGCLVTHGGKIVNEKLADAAKPN